MSKFVLSIVAILLINLTALDCFGQKPEVDAQYIANDSFIAFTINTMAIGKKYADSEATARIEKALATRGLSLETLRHFQGIFSGPNDSGPDGVVHYKVVLSEEKEFDAKSIGKMSGYTLTEGKIEDRPYFVGGSENAWGGFQGAPNVAVVAVERKAKAILANLADDSKLAEILEAQSGSLDVTIAFVPNQFTSEFAIDIFGDQLASDLFNLVESGHLNFDFSANNFVFGEAIAKSEDAATELHDKLTNLIKLGAAMARRNANELKKDGGWAEMGHKAELMAVALESIRLEQDGKTLTISSQKEGGFQAAIEALMEEISSGIL